jgi:hypothetical protein
MVRGGTVIGTTMAPVDTNTGIGLIEFLDAAIEKGRFNVASIKALRTATLKIFEVECGWESTNLHSLDGEQPLRSLPQTSSGTHTATIPCLSAVEATVLTCSRRRPSSGPINRRG